MMPTYKDKVRSIGAHAGMIGPIVGLAMLFIAIYYAPWFSFSVNSLSDLGINGYSFVFNIGAIASGIMIAVFFISLLYLFKRSAIFSILGAIGAIALEMVGVFNETYPIHVLLAAIYFIAVPIAIAGISAMELGRHRLLMRYGILSAIASIVIVTMGFLLTKIQLSNGIGFATNEFAEVLLLSVWVFAFGYMLLKNKI